MRTLRLIGGLALLLVVAAGCRRTVTVTEFSIVPEPVFMVQKEGSLDFATNPRISLEGLGQNSATVKYIMKSLRHAHIHPRMVRTSEKSDIELVINDTANSEIGAEGYLLEVRSSGVRLSANSEIGLLYAYQTLVQMLPPDVAKRSYRHVVLPECTILDYPRYDYRGGHLDVCSHFFSTKFVKRYIDLMVQFKLNKFHWQLTGDYGWRMPSEHYPQLNLVGSWRPDVEGVPQPMKAHAAVRSTYGGLYSKEDVAEVVQYAADRGIEVIPEISLPLHCAALTAAMPALACVRQGGEEDAAATAICLGSDSSLAVAKDLLDEAMFLFPSRYVNINCKGLPAEAWNTCPRCQARMKALHLRTVEELQGWFVEQLEMYAVEKGHTLIGYEGILTGGAGSDAVVTYSAGKPRASRRRSVILSPEPRMSFDHYQADPRYQPLSVSGMVTLRGVYAATPAWDSVGTSAAQAIWGGEYRLPTTYAKTATEAEYMLLPRMLAAAESFWSPAAKMDWGQFRRKVEDQKERLAAKGYSYCEGSFTPLFTAHRADDRTMNIAITTEVPSTYLFYTTDSTTPTRQSAIYIGPVNLGRGTHIKILPVYKDVERDSVYEFIIK